MKIEIKYSIILKEGPHDHTSFIINVAKVCRTYFMQCTLFIRAEVEKKPEGSSQHKIWLVFPHQCSKFSNSVLPFHLQCVICRRQEVESNLDTTLLGHTNRQHHHSKLLIDFTAVIRDSNNTLMCTIEFP